MTLFSKRKPVVLLLLIFMCAALPWFACDNSKSTNPAGSGDPEISASKVTGGDCKTLEEIANGETPPNQDCLQYSYGEDGVLQITRTNAGFNCCPDSFGVEIDLTENVITITENEFLTNGCFCLCLYDLQYSISGLPEGEYTIRVVEPYVTVSDQNAALEFDIDFSKTPSGEFCVYRTTYPWSIGVAPEP